MKSRAHERDNRLAVTKKPLVMKKISTAMPPGVVPSAAAKGSVSFRPVASAKEWLYKTSIAAMTRTRLKLLSRLPAKLPSVPDRQSFCGIARESFGMGVGELIKY